MQRRGRRDSREEGAAEGAAGGGRHFQLCDRAAGRLRHDRQGRTARDRQDRAGAVRHGVCQRHGRPRRREADHGRAAGGPRRAEVAARRWRRRRDSWRCRREPIPRRAVPVRKATGKMPVLPMPVLRSGPAGAARDAMASWRRCPRNCPRRRRSSGRSNSPARAWPAWPRRRNW